MARLVLVRPKEILSDAHLRAIGLIAHRWSILESATEAAIWGLLSLDHSQGKNVTPHIALRVRLEIIEALARRYFQHTEPNTIKNIKAAINRINQIKPKRDNAIHGMWQRGESEDKARRFIIKARGKFVVTWETLSAADLLAVADEIDEVSNQFLAVFYDRGLLEETLPRKHP